jgi:hypothetical protein
MLHATQDDSKKLQMQIGQIISAHPARQFIFADNRRLYEVCRFSKLQLRQLRDEVNDVLSGTAFCKAHGVWNYSEYGDGWFVFTKFVGSDNDNSPDVIDYLCDNFIAAKYEFAAESKNGRAAKLAERAAKLAERIKRDAIIMLSVSKIMLQHGVEHAAAMSNKYDAERKAIMMAEGMTQQEVDLAIDEEINNDW